MSVSPSLGGVGKRTITRTKSSDVEDGVLVETNDVYTEEDSGVDPVYQAKARLLNDAIQEVGMGKYQVNYSSFLKRSFTLLSVVLRALT